MSKRKIRGAERFKPDYDVRRWLAQRMFDTTVTARMLRILQLRRTMTMAEFMAEYHWFCARPHGGLSMFCNNFDIYPATGIIAVDRQRNERRATLRWIGPSMDDVLADLDDTVDDMAITTLWDNLWRDHQKHHGNAGTWTADLGMLLITTELSRMSHGQTREDLIDAMARGDEESGPVLADLLEESGQQTLATRIRVWHARLTPLRQIDDRSLVTRLRTFCARRSGEALDANFFTGRYLNGEACNDALLRIFRAEASRHHPPQLESKVADTLYRQLTW